MTGRGISSTDCTTLTLSFAASAVTAKIGMQIVRAASRANRHRITLDLFQLISALLSQTLPVQNLSLRPGNPSQLSQPIRPRRDMHSGPAGFRQGFLANKQQSIGRLRKMNASVFYPTVYRPRADAGQESAVPWRNHLGFRGAASTPRTD